MWWMVAIAGCLALAGCVGLALLWPRRPDSAELRPLAHTERLVRLPEYVSAQRRQLIGAVVTIALLVLGFVATVLVAARPSGLPALAQRTEVVQPQDIMVCVGAPLSDPAVSATLAYFAEQAPQLGADRIGLTSANRRVLPLTRDQQTAAQRFAEYAQPDPPQAHSAAFVAPVRYADYMENVQDVLALCLTGFPSFTEPTGPSRVLIYVGPDTQDGRQPGQLFGSDDVRDLAERGAVQINAISTGTGGRTLSMLAERTGGRVYPASDDVPARLDDIRNHPPAPVTADDGARARLAETPDLPVVLALLAVLGLAVWSVVVRR